MKKAPGLRKQVELRGRTARRWRRGTALVELAACLPVFMLTLIGIIEFGRAMSVSQLLNAAAREGCRSAIIDGSSNSGVQTAIAQQVANTVKCPTSAVTVSIVVTSNRNNATLSGLNLAEPRDLITINVTVPHAQCSYAFSRWLEGKTLRGQCAMRHE